MSPTLSPQPSTMASLSCVAFTQCGGNVCDVVSDVFGLQLEQNLSNYYYLLMY